MSAVSEPAAQQTARAATSWMAGWLLLIGSIVTVAFTLVSALRLEHQVQQLRDGERPDNHLRPEDLNPLTRSYLKDAFRAVAAVQRRVDAQLTYGVV